MKESMSAVQKGLAFLSGAMLVLTLTFIALTIQKQIGTTGASDFVTLFVLTILVGVSTGHYLGYALMKSGSKMLFFLFGIFASFFGLILYQLQLSHLGVSMLLMSGTVLFLHISGLVAEHESIEGFLDVFAGLVSTGGLGVISLIKYLVPFLIYVFKSVF